MEGESGLALLRLQDSGIYMALFDVIVNDDAYLSKYRSYCHEEL